MQPFSCKTCRFYHCEEEDQTFGQCRRNSPGTLYDEEDGTFITCWPFVSNTEFCGQHEENPYRAKTK